MAKIAIVVLSNTEDPVNHGRFIHALTAAEEMKKSGADFKFIFEGMGATWLKALHEKEHPVVKAYGAIFEGIKGNVLGACNFCTNRFDVRKNADALQVPMLGEDGEHWSIGQLAAQGYQFITF